MITGSICPEVDFSGADVSSTLLLWWIRRNPQGLRRFF
jgi:hypothetical protein